MSGSRVIVTNQMIRKVSSEAVKAEFLGVIEDLAALTDHRADRLRKYSSAKKTFSAEATKVVELFTLKERQHIDHVRRVMADSGAFHPERNLHDFSKDDLYFFATSAKFACGISGKEMDKLVDMETRMHYLLEPHHEAYETLHDTECSEEDLIEMAIDRMSRNIQANNGEVDLESMREFTPKFVKGSAESRASKRERYWVAVHEYQGVCEKVYREM